jgi:hypothetical protein
VGLGPPLGLSEKIIPKSLDITIKVLELFPTEEISQFLQLQSSQFEKILNLLHGIPHR